MKKHKLFATAAGLACAVLVAGCATPGYKPVPGTERTGLASWYGAKFHGRKTASGEAYNMYHLTGAHKDLAFGTFVQVTNADNGKSVIIRINDRGPFIEGRVLDLSYAAAKKIEMIRKGVVPVRYVELIEK